MIRGHGVVLESLAAEYGGSFRHVTETPTVGVNPAELVAGDADRVFLLVVNLGVNDSFLSPTWPPSASAGIRLGNGGGWVSWNLREDGLLPALQWHAVAPVGNSVHFVLTVRRDTLLPRDEVPE